MDASTEPAGGHPRGEGASRVRSSDAVDAALRRLMAEGTLSPEQAERVRAELTAASAAGSRPNAPATPARPVGPLAEAAGYTGGVLAAAAGIALGSQVWPRLETWAQVAVLAVVAAVLWAAGRVLVDAPAVARGRREATASDGPVGRLAGTLWLASTAATAAAAGVASDGLLGASGETVALVIGVATLLHGLLLWRARPGALQLLGPYAGVLLTVLAALEHLPRPPQDSYPLIGWAIGVAGLALAWGRIAAPPRAAHAVGAIIALVSAQLLAFDFGGTATSGLLLGLATALGLLGFARVAAQPVLTGLGAAGLAVFVPQLLSELFPGSLVVPAAVFIGGVGLLAAAIVYIRTQRHDARGRELGGDGRGGRD